MSKFFTGVILIGAIILLGIGGYLLLNFHSLTTDDLRTQLEKNQQRIEEKEPIGSTDQIKKDGVGDEVEEKEPIVYTGQGIITYEQVVAEMPLTMTEEEVQDAIHFMSHQKVRAEKKEGYLQITPERIKRLLEVVEANTYEKTDAYLNILNAWKVEDYSQVELHHNTIWTFQGGNIGQAYGLLSRAEEEAFIKEHYQN